MFAGKIQLRVVRSAASVLTCIALSAGPARAFVPHGSSWPGLSATFTRNNNAGQMPAGSGAAGELGNAMTLWEEIPGTDWNFVVATCLACPAYGVNDGTNYVEFADLGGSTLGVTTWWRVGTEIVDADIRMDSSNRTWNYNPGTNPDNPFGSPFEFRIVMAHELGHAIGFDHDDNELAAMNAIYHMGETYFSTPRAILHADEHDGIRQLYPDAAETDRDLGVTDFAASIPDNGGQAGVLESPFARTGSGSRNPPASANATAGGIYNIQYTTENYGTQSETFDVAFMLSTNGFISTADREIGRVTGLTNGIEVTSTRTVNLTIPLDVATGTYYVGPFVDPDNDIPERRDPAAGAEFNNGLPSPVPVDIDGGPDLVITSLTTPAQVKKGCSSFDVTFTVENQGGDPAGAFECEIEIVALFCSRSLGTTAFAGLAAGASTNRTVNVTLDENSCRGEGLVALKVTADHLDQVAELLENNNDRGNLFSYPVPKIASIDDVPNDQGRQVRINFDNSMRDIEGSVTPILQYEAFRRIDPPTAQSPVALEAGSAAAEERVRRARAAGMTSDLGILLAGWEFVGAVPAHAESEYNMIAPTVVDVTSSTFFIRAATAAPAVYFDSCTESGASVDNLAPGVPASFRVVERIMPGGDLLLDWDPNPEEDFRFYSLHRGTDPDFVPSVENRVTRLTEDTFLDPGAGATVPVYYKLSATDFADNESGFALASTFGTVAVDPAAGLPLSFALHPSAPNPMRFAAVIRFDLPVPSAASLEIFDVQGRRVRTLVDSPLLPAGRHRWEWDRRTTHGDRAAAGVYFCRFRSPQYSKTMRMVVTE